MNKYLPIGIVTILSCNQVKQTETKVDTLVNLPVETKEAPVPQQQGSKISGDFNGDGKMEFAYAIRVKEGEGNPVEDGTPDEYAVIFSDTTIVPFKIGCCEARLINEGDLNHDDADEISTFQAPMNGNTYDMTTHTFKGNNWKALIETFMIPTGGDYISEKELEERIFMENDTLYMYNVDYSDDNLKLIKKKVTVN
jgi:hypothetical protein